MLDKLFLDVVDTQDELERLKSCPHDHGWTKFGERLKERLLPKVHQSYLNTMRDMQETVQELGEELGVEKVALQERLTDGKGRFSASHVVDSGSEKKWTAKMGAMAKRSQGRMSYEGQRVKFSQGKTRRDALFDQIEAYMRSLDGLMSKNDDVAKILRSSQRPSLIHRGMMEFWQHARNIYSLLLLSWRCPCRIEHCADLLLKHREAPDVSFEICFRFDPSLAKCSRKSWTSHKVIVEESKVLVRSSPSSAIQTPGPAVKPGSSQQIVRNKKIMPAKSALKRSSKQSRITHSGTVSSPSIPPTVSNNSASAPTSSQANPSVQILVALPTLLPEIRDLCQAISTHGDKQPCSGLLTAKAIDKEYSLRSPATTTTSPVDSGITTLATLLSDISAKPKRVDRYKIALAIASSHLQLHSSLWLGHQWSSENIHFDVVNGVVVIDQPHLRTGFSQNASVNGQNSSVDETFMTLGILLLELCFGTSLEQSPFRNKYRSPDGQQDSMMDLAAAMKWAEHVEGEAGPEYADAVYWCLRFRRLNQIGNAWRQDLLQTVVEPLKVSVRV